MKHKFNKLIILLPFLFLTSCGLASKDLYQGDIFNSPVFARNYYSQWDKEISSFKGESGEIKTIDKLFRTYNEFVATGLDQEAAMWNYFYLPKYFDGNGNYAYYRKMRNYDNVFNYHYLSKLYDGQMFCGGDYQLSRVQIDKDGYGQYFDKEGRNAKYFAMNFKASVDYTNTTLLSKIYQAHPGVIPSETNYQHLSDVNLTVSIYTKDNGEIIKHDFTQLLSNVKTNYSESFTGSEYVFFGFSLEDFKDERIVGYSVNYTYNDPVCNCAPEFGETLDYSLMVYEVLMPLTSWH